MISFKQINSLVLSVECQVRFVINSFKMLANLYQSILQYLSLRIIRGLFRAIQWFCKDTEILLLASCYRKLDKLPSDGPLVSPCASSTLPLKWASEMRPQTFHTDGESLGWLQCRHWLFLARQNSKQPMRGITRINMEVRHVKFQTARRHERERTSVYSS